MRLDFHVPLIVVEDKHDPEALFGGSSPAARSTMEGLLFIGLYRNPAIAAQRRIDADGFHVPFTLHRGLVGQNGAGAPCLTGFVGLLSQWPNAARSRRQTWSAVSDMTSTGENDGA
jgi:hypothetical protein